MPGRLDASAFKPPYSCSQVAHDASTCKTFFVSNAHHGTAQLCEWSQGGCIAKRVVDCARPPPPAPPPPPSPPPPTLSNLARAAMKGNVSKFVAAEQMIELGQQQLHPYIHETADMVASASGNVVKSSQVETWLPIVVAALLAIGVVGCCCAPAPTKKRVERKVRGMAEAVSNGKMPRRSSGRTRAVHDDEEERVGLNGGEMFDDRPMI